MNDRPNCDEYSLEADRDDDILEIYDPGGHIRKEWDEFKARQEAELNGEVLEGEVLEPVYGYTFYDMQDSMIMSINETRGLFGLPVIFEGDNERKN